MAAMFAIPVFAIACLGAPAQAKSTGARTIPGLKALAPVQDDSREREVEALFDDAKEQHFLGNNAEAERLFKEVLKLDPKNADAHFNLGAVLEWQKRIDEALDHYKAAQALRPSDQEIAQATRALAEKSQENARALSEKTRQDHKRHLAVLGQQAKEAFSSQNYETAVQHLHQLASAMPSDARVQFALGQSLRALKVYDWATYRLKMAIYLDPENALYRHTIADLDAEMHEAQQRGMRESAQVAVGQLRPLVFSEAAASGL